VAGVRGSGDLKAGPCPRTSVGCPTSDSDIMEAATTVE